MAYNIVVDPNAISDITESIDWYNNTVPGLGLKYYKQLQFVFKTISKNPYLFSVRYKNHRTAVVKKFPHMVHYFIDTEKDLVVVTSVLHTSRKPDNWTLR